MKKIIYIFLISMLPLIELRGAIPVGAALGVEFYYNFIAAVIGNLLPVSFILLFIPKILEFLARFKAFRPMVEWLNKKAMKNKGKIAKTADEIPAEADTGTVEAQDAKDLQPVKEKSPMPAGAFIGLLLFVMIPAPGTGAWTGSLVAALFNYPKRRAFLAIMLGVLGSGVIMCLASYGVLGFLSFLAK